MSKIKSATLCLVHCALCIGTAMASAIVANGAFEAGADGAVAGWKAEGMFSFRAAGGLNGSGALLCENGDPKGEGLTAQEVSLETGRRYRFSVWVRTELAGKGGATARMDWFRPDGRLFDWGYADNTVSGTCSWTKVEGVTTPIPEESVKFKLQLVVKKGATGRAWFDNASVELLPQTVFSGLASTAYRGVAASGDVRFTGLVNPEWEGLVAPDKVFLNYLDADGAAKCAAVDADFSATLPVSALKLGTQTVVLAAQDGHGDLLGTAGLEFTRVETLPERTVWFDAQGRTIVDGKPFFPLGMYAGGVSSNVLSYFEGGPFNCLMPYSTPKTTDVWDMCHAKGIKLIHSIATYRASEEADREVIEKAVGQFKDHPALLAWYICDERPLSMLPRLVRRRELFERLDPNHPCWAVFYQYDAIQWYMPAFDVVGTDPYPIPDWPFSMAAKWARWARRGTRGCKPLWQVPQAFSFSCYGKKEGVEREVRSPTEPELRSMCWQGIANGANGLILYSWFDLKGEKGGRPFEERWDECRRVVGEIKSHVPVLLDDELHGYATLVPQGEPGPLEEPVAIRVWRHDGEIWLLAVNPEEKAAEAEISLSEAASSVTAVFGPEPKLGDDGKSLTFALAPLEPAFVRLAAK